MDTGNAGSSLPRISLPDGFSIQVFAKNVEGARSMVLGENGTLFVGSRSEGKVYAIIDKNKDFKADSVVTIASGLNSPNGVAFRNGSLYVAEIHRVIRFDNIESSISRPPSPVVVNDSFPSETHHGWKFIAFGPDGKLYVPVGAPCNNCLSKDKIFASIMRMNADGSDLEIYSHGVRNTVGFDWHPESSILYFTDNGRDWMGDNRPPDELNRAAQKGIHFGYPFCHGNDILDPEFGKGKKCAEYTPPVRELGPHVAALGMRFYTGKQFPEKYRNRVFIAEHGSWNRSTPIGYRITMVSLEGKGAPTYEVFAEGWLEGASAWGRPVDVLVYTDGSLLVSDDRGGTIYRIFYK
ncbi:MAG TPA: sorbosone dehydrogenase family protein [Spirochaetota bacterium]|nr:sorbosone dehydrogenase family protein [Spirochaetota bacterium]